MTITVNSLKSKLIFYQLLAGICFAAAQYQGVKGGHYYQTTTTNSDNNSQAGTCYKRVSYHEALAIYNKTGSIHNHGYRPQWNNTYDNGYVMVLDCCDGYQRNAITNQCEYASTDCRAGCFGGRCVSGQCTCDPGWHPVEGVCKPICRRPCGENAYCFSPEVCECKLGWERDSPQGVCRPVCPGGCVNGDCIAPHVCQCRPGYTLNGTRERCDAVCEGGCHNGVCIAPGVCNCHPGFKNPPGERKSCVPDCGPCENGRCVSSGLCECKPGYRKDPASETCIAECRNGCPVNGHCVAPNRCECYNGYRLDYGSNQCVSLNYQTGGYRLDNQPNSYQPDNYQPNTYHPENQGGIYRPNQQGNPQDCDHPCVNGVCMGYNICSCRNGYIPDPEDLSRTKCIPLCPGGCPNGVCSGPNFCICKPGFVKDRGVKGSQRCIPQYN
ncbi:uncharacterized protein LOC141524216 [Cotesia typhae]